MTHTKHGRAPFVLLCLIGSATFFSSYLRIPVLPLFAATLGAGPAQVGMINGAFMVTAGLLSIPAGLLVDRLGRTKPVIGGIVATAVSSLLVTQCSSPLQLAAAYLLFGAGLAAFAPAMLSLVADIVPSERLGRAYGWYTTAIYVAMTIGPASGGYLAKTVGLRNVFFVSGIMLATMALLALLVLPRTAARHKTELHAALAASLTLLHNRPLRACLLATTGSCIGFGLFLTFRILPHFRFLRGTALDVFGYTEERRIERAGSVRSAHTIHAPNAESKVSCSHGVREPVRQIPMSNAAQTSTQAHAGNLR